MMRPAPAPRRLLFACCVVAALSSTLSACVLPRAHRADSAARASDEADTAPAAVLVFTRTAGYRHDSIATAVDTLRALAPAAGLTVEHSEDPALFADAALRRYRAVVFANTTGDVLDAGQRAAFERYVRGGGGFLGIHSAADTEYGAPWYGELVGAWFAGHPPGLQRARVRFEGDAPRARTRVWWVTDELYDYRRNPRPWVRVIATVDERDYAGGGMGADHPIAWCHARFGGRAWYTGLGHDAALYRDATYRAHLLRGLRYVAGRSDAC